MPKQMLMDVASQLRDIAEQLDGYAGEMDDEGDEGETDTQKVSEGDMGDKQQAMKLASASIKQRMGSYK